MVQEKLQNPSLEGVNWHTMADDLVLAKQDSSLEGLTNAEAKNRQAQYGPNQLTKKKAVTPLELLWRQINSPLIWILIGSAALAFIADPKDGVKNGLVILAVVILNALIGFVQEFRANKAIEALKDFVPEFANVMRDGKQTSVPVAELVPGDVVMVASGDRVPADVRLIKCRTLLIEEAALTGESVPSEKQLGEVAPDAPLGDRLNMAFGGTLVTSGAGTGVVVQTGDRTELGRINTMLNEATEMETPLGIALEKIGKILTYGIVAVAIAMLIVGTVREVGQGTALIDGIRQSVIFAITLAVGAIPEGLPAIVTIALAIGVQRMAARKAVVRQLPSVETLGSTTVICSDKTGTLTKNEMTVQALWTEASGRYEVTGVGYEPKGEVRRDGQTTTLPAEAQKLVLFAALCTDATLEMGKNGHAISGDPTEGALVVAAEKIGIDVDEAKKTYRRIDAIPFESENQFMATLNEVDGQPWILMKGAPEVVLRRSTGVNEDEVHNQIDSMAANGMRVLGVAAKRHERGGQELTMEDAAGDFTFLGLEGMIDPPRQEVIDAIRKVHGAHVTVKMITGDHIKTAEAIGEQLNIRDGKPAISGKKLEETSDADLRTVVENSNVFARVAPEHKLRLVRALQENGHVAAMTGDGVNDAPALKQSNIGIAMGITGTSVSKEAADIVLADDNFASIVAAVEEGRRVYDNLIKSLAFVLPTNLGLALILCYAVAFFPFKSNGELMMPMLPPQILWINLVAAVALALPLAFEAMEPDVMTRRPRDIKEPVLNKFVVSRTVMAAVLMSIAAVGLFLWRFYSEMPRVDAGELTYAMATAEAQTMAVTTVIMFQIFYVLNCRSLKDSIFRIGLFSNPTVYVGIGALLLLQGLFIYTPVANQIFNSAPLDAKSLALSIAAGAIILPVISLEKWWRTRKGE